MGRGTTVRYATGRRAKFCCPRCGDVIPYREARYEADTQSWVCWGCVDEVEVARKPVRTVLDAEALHHPRPLNDHYIVSPQIARLAFDLTLWQGQFDIEATSYADVLGAEAVFGTGAFTPLAAKVVTPSGLQIVAETGAFEKTIAKTPAGLEMVAEISAPAGLALGVGGGTVEAVMEQGAPVPALMLPLSGVEIAVEAGVFAIEATSYVDTSGMEAVFEVGAIEHVVGKSPSGLEVAAETGIIVATTSKAYGMGAYGSGAWGQ